jgi:cysteine-rich repeat protein
MRTHSNQVFCRTLALACVVGLWGCADDRGDQAEELQTALVAACKAPGKKVERCGDGLANLCLGEACDTGGNSAACDADCTAVVCGDGFVNPAAGEQCDPGGAGGGTDFCDSDCTISRCGDGVVNPLAGEACDTGGDSATCDVDCTPAVCGDGRVNPLAGEACDDGNVVASDGCDACQLAGICSP